MTGQKMHSQKEPRKLAYVLIPTCLFIGVGLGWALSHFKTRKGVIRQKKNSAGTPPIILQDRFREIILAIDNDLNATTDVEHRKFLVTTAHKLRDLALHITLQGLPKLWEPKTDSSVG